MKVQHGVLSAKCQWAQCKVSVGSVPSVNGLSAKGLPWLSAKGLQWAQCSVLSTQYSVLGARCSVRSVLNGLSLHYPHTTQATVDTLPGHVQLQRGRRVRGGHRARLQAGLPDDGAVCAAVPVQRAGRAVHAAHGHGLPRRAAGGRRGGEGRAGQRVQPGAAGQPAADAAGAAVPSVASPALAAFLEHIALGYMIDNVVLLLGGALRSFSDATKTGAATPAPDGAGSFHEQAEALLARCHPLGFFETMPALLVATSIDEIYSTVLVESPLAGYFRACLSADALDDLHIELIRNQLWRAHLEAFHRYCQDAPSVNAATRALMQGLLAFEADRRTISIAVNACGSERLARDERLALFPRFGTLWDAGVAPRLAQAEDVEQVRAVLDAFPAFRMLLCDWARPADAGAGASLAGSTSTASYELPPNAALTRRERPKLGAVPAPEPRTLEEHFFEHEVALCKDTFDVQFSFACFYGWTRLKEQEIRNVVWIAECIAQQQRQNIHNYIPLF